jgi:hypothetical protein
LSPDIFAARSASATAVAVAAARASVSMTAPVTFSMR